MKEERLSDGLSDLAPALRVMARGETGDLHLARRPNGEFGRILERYAIVPSSANPRVLLPLDTTASALRSALIQYTAGASNRLARVAARSLWVASWVGMAPNLLRDKVCVVTVRPGLTETYLHAFLSIVLGRRDFVTSIRIAPRRPNGKPVVQAVAADGTVLAYAKFGWEELTRQLVRHEASTLRELGVLTQGIPLSVPRVLYSGAWHDLETIVLAPLSGGQSLRPRSPSDIPIAASVALAALRPRICERLGDSEFWQRTVRQVTKIAPVLNTRDRELVVPACAEVAKSWGKMALPLGQSHGDWIPPNMAVTRHGVFNIWDWERSASDVPLGTDAMQFILYMEMKRWGAAGIRADRLRRYGEEALSRHGLDPKTFPVLMALNLLRTIILYGEARRAGWMRDEDRRYIRALALVLETCR